MANKRVSALTNTQTVITGSDYTIYSSSSTDYKITWTTIASWVLGGHTIGGTSAGDIVDLDTAQTMTSKTLTTPRINTPKFNEDKEMTATSTEINKLDGLATTKTELGYVAGATSNLQNQIDAKVGFADIADFCYQYNGDFTITGGTTDYTITEATILSALGITGGYYIDVPITVDFWSLDTNKYSKLMDSPTTIDVNRQTSYGQIHLDDVYISGISAGTFGFAIQFKLIAISGA